MKVAFKDESFAFEFVRNLSFVYYGGAERRSRSPRNRDTTRRIPTL